MLESFLLDLSNNEIFGKLNNEYLTINDFNTKYPANYNCSLNIMHLNIHSLNAKYNEFNNLVYGLNLQFDVIVLSEIWCTNIEFCSKILSNYKIINATMIYQRTLKSAGLVCL